LGLRFVPLYVRILLQWQFPPIYCLGWLQLLAQYQPVQQQQVAAVGTR
jgi:hypothetical protein